MAERTHGFLEAEAHPRLSALGGDPRPSFLFDRTGTLLWVNGAGAAYLGITAADRIAARGFGPDTVGSARIASLARQLAGAEERTLRIALPKGLLPDPVVCRAARVIVGSERCVLLIVVDGSGRLAAADAAARHIALLATLPATAPAGEPAPAALIPHDADPYAVALPAGADGDADAEGDTATVAVPQDTVLADATPTAVAAEAEAEAEAEPEAITPDSPTASDASSSLASSTDHPADGAEAVDAADAVVESDAAPLRSVPRFVPPSHGRMVRFVFELDGGLAFSFLSDDLSAVVGPAAAAVVGETWASAAGRLGIDPLGRVGKALGGRDTFTGLTVDWPVQDSDLRVPVDLAGMPMFSRDRSFRGYRGFGVAKCGALFPAPMVVTGDSLIPAEKDIGTDAAPALVDATEPETVTIPPSIPDPEPAADLGTAWTETGLEDDIAAQTSEPLPTGAEAATAHDGAALPDTAPAEPADAPAGRAGAGLRSLAAAALDGIVPRPIAPPRANSAPERSADMAGAASPEDAAENPDAPPPEAPGQPAPASPPATPEIQPAPPEGPEPEAPEGPEPDAPSRPDRPNTPHPEYPAPGEPAAPAPQPEEAPGSLPEEAPSGAPAETPVGIPDEAPAGMPDEAPSGMPDEVSGPAGMPSEFAAEAAGAVEAASPVPADATAAAVDQSHPEVPVAEAPVAEPPVAETPVSRDAGTGGASPSQSVVIQSPIVARPVPKVVQTEEDIARGQLSRPEREAFQKIAEALGARLEGGAPAGKARGPAPQRPAQAAGAPAVVAPATPAPAGETPPLDDDEMNARQGRFDFGPEADGAAGDVEPTLDRALLDRLPLAIAILRDGEAVFVNRAFLDLTQYETASALDAAGGFQAAFAGSTLPRDASLPAIRRRDGVEIPVSAKVHSVTWGASVASLLIVQDTAAATGRERAADAEQRVEELEGILDTATDGVLVIDDIGVVLAANKSAEALFGMERSHMVGAALVSLLAPESHRDALDYIDGLSRNGLSSVLNDGREVIGRVKGGGLVPLFMTAGRVSAQKFCAVLRDITQWKRAEEELTNAKRAAETASSQKSEFLAKISHEIRTPLNAIIGFSEVMMEERFGPVGSDRYKEYLRDIHISGAHIMSLVNDLLDLSKIEAGKLDLTFEAVAPNDVIRECVALMQPQANRERVIIRTSLSSSLPAVVADSRSLRQIVLNLLSNAIKFNTPGGQVIVSTLYEETGEVAVRVRDTGPGMSEEDISKALEPFRQLQTARPGRGTGLGLPLTKALVEANRAIFRIDSTVGQGTLVQVTFPSTRVLAE